MRQFFDKKIIFLIVVSLISILISVLVGVRDFSTYAIQLLILIALFFVGISNIRYNNFIFSGFLFLLLLHMFGVAILINGERLYTFYIIPELFAYDNIVHATGAFIATVLSYSFFYNYIKFDDSALQKFYCFSLLVLVGLGIGAGIEILELFAVLFFDSPDLTGWYINNAVDLVFDTLGAMIAAWYLVYFKK